MTIRQLNFETVRHLVLNPTLDCMSIISNPIFVPFVPNVMPISVSCNLVHFAVPHHRLTTRTSSNHQTLKWSSHALDWTVLEQVASVATVVPLVPMQGQPQICAPIARPPVCTSPAVGVVPTRVRSHCVLLTGLCFLRVFVPLHLVKSFLPFLVVLFTLCFVLVLACQACLCPCPCLACLCFLSSVPDHPIVWIFCKYSVFFRQSLDLGC